jgi:hypothetical protein
MLCYNRGPFSQTHQSYSFLLFPEHPQRLPRVTAQPKIQEEE